MYRLIPFALIALFHLALAWLHASDLTLLLIVFSPLGAFIVNSFIVKKWTKLSVGLSCMAIFLSFVMSLVVFCDFLNIYSTHYYIHQLFTWIDLSYGDEIVKINMGLYIDSMTAVMLLMVSGVATLIHIFSTYYMADDPRFGRFFVYLSLFSSAMLGLVISDNLLSVFIFWEIMGFCSYSLIGFYYEKEEAGDASLKAFMTTRVGDVFFLLGIVMIWSVVGSVGYRDIYMAIANGLFTSQTVIGIPLISVAAFSIFMGTIGKSAQFPLQIWLPDAMMGPTPCSALIHAATMVAAGVYLSLRAFPLMEAAGLLPFIAYIGSITAFGAATLALIQKDFKAVLAYSTISQLGYMVLGIGVSSYNASFMHLITHAIFKACLFLSAGAVIHTIHTQDMAKMGGLKNKLKITWVAMWSCTLAIAGVPLFSGFVSKDRILGDALVQSIVNPIYIIPTVLGFIGALLTAFYMCRMMFLVFHGSPRDTELYDHIKVEKLTWNKNLPLLILSVFTLGIWFSGSLTGQGLIKVAGDRYEWFQTLIERPKIDSGAYRGAYQRSNNHYFEKAKYDPNHGLPEKMAHHVHVVHKIGALLSILIALLGISFAFMVYVRQIIRPDRWMHLCSNWYKALENKYYMDDFYIKGVIRSALLPLTRLLSFFDMDLFDRFVVDGQAKVNYYCFKFSRWFDDLWVDTVLVDGTGTSVRLFNIILRMLQSGKIQFYFIIIILVLTGYIWTIQF